MASFSRANEEAIPTFHLGDEYVFKYFFEETALFRRISTYYVKQKGRFEVPEAALADVQAALSEYSYALVVQPDVDEFVVGKRRYTDHPDVLFEQSVARRQSGNYHLYLMKDRRAVERAIDQGARPLADVDAAFEP